MLRRLERKESGKSNCVDMPFSRLRKIIPGFEPFTYSIISANQKVGKTKLTDYMFVYKPILERVLLRNTSLKTHCLYFSLEESEARKEYAFYSHLLYSIDKIRIEPQLLTSVSGRMPRWVVEKLDSPIYQQCIQDFEANVEYIEDIKNPTGIYKYCKDYSSRNGKYNTVMGKKYDEVTGTYYETEVLDKKNPLTWNDPDTYHIIIIDNFANLATERGWTLKETIDKMSKYCIELAKLGFIVIGVQHQQQAQEGLEAQKYGKITPSVDGLGDAKTTARDVNLVLGLFSPSRFNIPSYGGYDITQWKDRIRFLSILAARDYRMDGTTQIPLLFRGDVSHFEELPRPENTMELDTILRQLDEEERQISLMHTQQNSQQTNG